MNYNYTEEHYAEMYNNLPEGLKDLVISGRLAIQVAAIGTRHGLNADQVADLEPAVEDLCLGLILKNQLAENIKTQVNTDDRVANRIAAEVEIEILRPFEPELIIARQQKEDLDRRIIAGKNTPVKSANNIVAPTPAAAIKKEFEPQNVSEHSNVSAIKNFYNSGSNTNADNSHIEIKNNPTPNFDWDNFGKKEETKTEEKVETVKPVASLGVEEKIDKLTDSINQLVNSRFGGDKKDEPGLSEEMKKIMQRLEEAEKENAENKKLIIKLQGGNNGDTSNKIQIDKPRNVDIDKSGTVGNTKVADDVTGNVQVKTISQNIPIHTYSSTVTQDTADTIVETRNKEKESIPVTSAAKKVLSLDELISKGDDKIKEASKTTGQLVFPSISASKQIDIKNIAQTDSLRQTLLEDIEFLKKKNDTPAKVETTKTESVDKKEEKPDLQNLTSTATTSVTLNQFKDEIIPKTKEDRMKSLQDKIKAMNKSVSVGGANSIAATALDPYKI